MNSETQHDPGYERRKAEFKREYIKRKRRERLIHNSIVIAIRVVLVILILLIGFKIVDRIFLPLNEMKKSQEVNKSQGTTEKVSQQLIETPVATASGEVAALLTIVNKDNPLEEGYVPELVECYHTIFVDKRVSGPLTTMLDAARKEGCAIYVASGYRTSDRQNTLYEEKADSDKPGYSEHQLGLAVDLAADEQIDTDQEFADTNEYAWLSKKCAKYGFIIRYPKGKEEVTGHEFDPCHLRYVGEDAATAIMEQMIALEEYKK